MKKQENKLDALLRQKLEGLEGDVSPQDWNAISERLDNEQKKPGGFFAGNRKYFAAAAFALLITFAGYYVGKQNTSVKQTSNTTIKTINEIAEKENTPSSKNNSSTQTTTQESNTNLNSTSNNTPEKKQSMTNTKTNNSPGSFNANNNKGSVRTVHPIVNNQQLLTKKGDGEQNIKTAFAGDRSHASTNPASHPSLSSDAGSNPASGGNNSQTLNSGIAANQNAKNVLAQKSQMDEKAIRPEKNTYSSISPDSAKTSAKTNASASLPETTNDSENAKKQLAQNTLKADSTTNDTKKPALNLPAKTGRITFYVSLAGDYSNHSLSANNAQADRTHEDYMHLRSTQEKGGIGYNFSAGAEFKPWKNILFQTGIGYNRISENVNYNFVNNKIPVVDSASGKILAYITVPNGTRTQYTHTNSYNYISIPFLAGYSFRLSSKFSLSIKAGGALMFLSSVDGEILKADDLTLQSLDDKKQLRNLNFSYDGRAELEYALSRYISLAFGTSYLQVGNSLFNPDAAAGFKPSGAGAYFSMKLKTF